MDAEAPNLWLKPSAHVLWFIRIFSSSTIFTLWRKVWRCLFLFVVCQLWVGVQPRGQDFRHFTGDKFSGFWIIHQLLHFQNLPDMRHKSVLSWKIPTLQFALDSFQAADQIKQRLLSFCGQDGQLFPCGRNSSGISVYYRCSWAAHDINQWHTADLPLWDAWN